MSEPRIDVFNAARFKPVPLFLERMSSYWISIWRCWRTVLDWTVWLYIFIPVLFILGGMYRDLIINPPEWLYDIPISVFLTPLGLLQLVGSYRTFAEPGDGLFLHRYNRWIRGMTVSGFVYSFVTRILISSAYIALISPLLLHVLGLSISYLIYLVIYCVTSGFVWMMLKDRYKQKWRGWLQVLALLFVRLVYMTVFVWLAVKGEHDYVILVIPSVIFLLVALWQMRIRLRMKGTLLHEINVENEAYIASVGWILRDTMEKKPVPKRRGPILFKRSQPFVKHRNDTYRLLDSWFKSVLRRMDLMKPLMYLTGLGAIAVGSTPIALAIILWLVLPFLLLGLLQRQWLQWLTEPYIALFGWRDDILEQASRKAKFWSGLPTVTIWAILIGVRIGLEFGGIGWIATVILPAIGFFWLKGVNEIVSSFGALRRKKE
ncbi:ABC transporter permease [Cohnella abietis]|uniref:ABC transporter permease n=1 Tax=Cohnella abietis TaxID=2507935 RepID=A0A3T1DCV2_9BACL|nr:ABC transporter permease [Cohnella abietis]BBI35788.1 ABC transporter permease [Cohnella abietis]